MGRLEGIDPEPEPVEEFEIVRQTAEQSLAQMNVRLDKTGNECQPGEVEPITGEIRKAPCFIAIEDAGDRGAFDESAPIPDHPAAPVHRDHRSGAEQQWSCHPSIRFPEER